MRAATLLVITLTACTVASGSQTGKHLPPAPSQKALPSLSAEEIFKRVSPSVMVVESLDATGKVTTLGSGVVIAPGLVTTNRHVIKDGITFRVEHDGRKWPAKLFRVDPDHDLAELSIAGLGAPAFTIPQLFIPLVLRLQKRFGAFWLHVFRSKVQPTMASASPFTCATLTGTELSYIGTGLRNCGRVRQKVN